MGKGVELSLRMVVMMLSMLIVGFIMISLIGSPMKGSISDIAIFEKKSVGGSEKAGTFLEDTILGAWGKGSVDCPTLPIDGPTALGKLSTKAHCKTACEDSKFGQLCKCVQRLDKVGCVREDSDGEPTDGACAPDIPPSVFENAAACQTGEESVCSTYPDECACQFLYECVRA